MRIETPRGSSWSMLVGIAVFAVAGSAAASADDAAAEIADELSDSIKTSGGTVMLAPFAGPGLVFGGFRASGLQRWM